MMKKAILWFANAELIEAIYSDRVLWLGPLWYCDPDGECGLSNHWNMEVVQENKIKNDSIVRGSYFLMTIAADFPLLIF